MKNNIFESIFKNDYRPKGNIINPYGEKPVNFGTPPTIMQSETKIERTSDPDSAKMAEVGALTTDGTSLKSKIAKIIVFAALVIVLVILIVYLYNKYFKKHKKTFSVDRLIEDYKTYKESKL